MKIKLFYGWYIVLSGLLIYAYSIAVFGYGFSAFVDPVLATFGWSYAQLSLASSLRSLETGVFNPLFGTLVDRWSCKVLMLVGVIATSLGIFLLSQTTNLVMYYAGFLIMGLGSSLTISIIPMTVMARWFKKGLGKASALYNLGGGVGGALVPVLVLLINAFGWRNTLMFSAFGFLVLGLPLSFVFRNRPQDYGLLPDGKAAMPAPGPEGVLPVAQGVDVMEAVRTRAFWYLGIATVFQFAALGLFSLYVIPYLTSDGMTREAASLVLMLYSLIALAGRIPLGILTDIHSKKYMMVFANGLMAVGLFLFGIIDGASPFWLILLFVIAFSLGASESLIVRPVIQEEYFGTKSFGRIMGLLSIFITVGGVTAPVLAGMIIDKYGVYEPIWLPVAGFGVLTTILLLTLRPAYKAEKPVAA